VLRSLFPQRLFLCALLFFLATNAAHAGFCVSWNAAADTESFSLPAETEHRSDPDSPKPILAHPEDAHAGGAGSSPSAVGAGVSGQCALPGESFELDDAELSSRMFGARRLDFPPPQPSGIFHPPRPAC
jgi:hypothetical protein